MLQELLSGMLLLPWKRRKERGVNSEENKGRYGRVGRGKGEGGKGKGEGGRGEGGRWGYKKVRNEDREGEEKTCMLKTSFKRCLRASVENLGLGMGGEEGVGEGVGEGSWGYNFSEERVI